MDVVQLEDRGGYALLRLDRPLQCNALNRAMREGLAKRLDEIRGRFKVAVITGSGDHFCAGIDLKEEAADRAAGHDTARQEWIAVLLALRRHPAIMICAVNGHALGGGMTLVNVADLAVVANEARLGMPELGFAAYPGMSGPSTQLVLSRKRAAWLMLTTGRIDGKTAEAWGLVNASVPAAELLDEADRLARQVARFDEVALAACKQALDAIPAEIAGWPDAFAYGLRINDEIRRQTEAQLAGLASFTQGRRNPGQGEP